MAWLPYPNASNPVTEWNSLVITGKTIFSDMPAFNEKWQDILTHNLSWLAEKQIENVLEALKDEKADPIRLEFSVIQNLEPAQKASWRNMSLLS